MTDIKDALGIKIGVLIAGFAGGIVSLQYLKGISRPQIGGALFTSLSLAAYGTPAVMQRLAITDQSYVCASAFILGLCAMRIVPLILQTVPAAWQWLASRVFKT